jgi:hypothetical protein
MCAIASAATLKSSSQADDSFVLRSFISYVSVVNWAKAKWSKFRVHQVKSVAC